jgi:hypothetical protein
MRAALTPWSSAVWRAAWLFGTPGSCRRHARRGAMAWPVLGLPWAGGPDREPTNHPEAPCRRLDGLSVFLLLTLGGLICAALMPTAALATEDRCDRARRYEALQAPDQQTLQRGGAVLQVQTHTGSAYHVGYVYHLVPYAPELVMAVFTSYEEHRGHLPHILVATVEAQHGPTARVRFVYALPWPLPNSEYVMDETVAQEGETYLLSWTLAPSSPSGVSAPRYAEGYFRAQPVGAGTLIIYCHYVIPGTGLWPAKVNREGLQAMQTTVHATARWVAAVAASSETTRRALARFRAWFAS